MNAQTQVATIPDQPRRSLMIDMATRYGMEPTVFAATLRATVVPPNTTNEEFAAFLMVAKEYELNPLLKEIYAFPKRGGGIQPIVSIDGWCNLVNSHPKLNGIEFDDHLTDGKVTAITARIWRKDREKPIVVTEYMAECVRATDTWKQYPRRMLRHKALIQCARYAFGFAGIVDPDEAERMGADVSGMRSLREDGPPAPPSKAAPAFVPEIASRPSDIELVESGRDNGEQVIMGDAEETSIAPEWSEEQWLRDLEGALSGCEDFSTAGEKQREIMMPEKKRASPAGWKAAEKLVANTLDRINTVLAAG